MKARTEQFTIDAKDAKRWPARLDGTVITFQNIGEDATQAECVEFLTGVMADVDALRSFVDVGVRNKLLGQLSNWLKGAESEGPNKDKARSEYVTAAQVAEYVATLKVEAPKRRVGQSPVAKVKAAEAKVAKAEAVVSATQSALLAMLRGMDKKAAAKQLAQFVADGILDAGTTL